MEHELVSVQNVKDIQAREKRWLEKLLGQKLQEHQQVFIMLLTPGGIPDEATRREALARMDRTFAKIDAHVQAQDIRPEEIDAAIDAATEHVRHRQP